MKFRRYSLLTLGVVPPAALFACAQQQDVPETREDGDKQRPLSLT